MIESLVERAVLTGKNTPERKLLAASLRRHRKLEIGLEYTVSRNGDLYRVALAGIDLFLNYARGLGEGPEILDIGAGTTLAISQIAKSGAGEGLGFLATTLARRTAVKDYLGYARTRVTSAEILRRIADQSIAGVLGVFSIGYTPLPECAAKSIDRVTRPGGIIKANFLGKVGGKVWKSDFFNDTGFSTHDRFTNALRALGYDIAILEGLNLNPEVTDIVLAIKPGGRQMITAQEILEIDKIFITPLLLKSAKNHVKEDPFTQDGYIKRLNNGELDNQPHIIYENFFNLNNLK